MVKALFSFVFLAFFGGSFLYIFWRYLRHMFVVERLAREAVEVANSEALARFQRSAADSGAVDFIVKQIFTIRFRDREIFVVDGRRGYVVVGGRSPSYVQDRHLFSCASPDEVAWFTAHPDVFKVAHSGAEGVIYYVNAGKI